MKENFVQNIIETTQDGFWLVSEPGRILDVNAAYCKMSGYHKNELLKMSVPDLEGIESFVDTAAHIKKIKENGSDRFESKHKRKDGSLFIVDVSTTYLNESKQFVSFIRDISKHKQIEERLKASEARSRTWLEHSPVCTKIVDTDFNLQYMSSAGIKGLQIDDITTFYGKPYPFYFYPDSFKNKMNRNLEKAKETGEIIVQEAPVVDTGGNELWFHSTIVPVNDNKNQLEYLIIVSLDTTKRNKAEKDKKNLQNRLNQAQKMEALGTLAGGIAHDFNNILAAILGYTEMAIDEVPAESEVAKDLGKAVLGCYRAKELIQQILAFSRQSEVETTPIQILSVLEEALKILRPSLPTTIEINKDIVSPIGQVLADPIQIHQLLINLCTNAFHAMEEKGGTINISLKEVTLSVEDLLQESEVEAGLFVQLSIGDKGVGIPSEIKKQIFDPYFTTRETGKGTGMGLAIVHGIVKSCGGFIQVESELGEGSVFHVFFPAHKQQNVTEVLTNETIPVGSGERILFIDDEETITEMNKSMLERLGYNVTAKNNSIEALEIFQNQPDIFDLVITDQTMPGMTGADLAKEIFQIRPDTPIILCTGYSSVISKEKAKSIGIKEFVLKPVSKKNLAFLIREVLGNR